jgi:hypothetical protein
MNYNYQNYGYTYPYNQQQYQQQPNTGYNQQLNQNLSNYNNYQGINTQQQAPQRAKCDFLAISNLDEVKSFIMQPNTTVLFKDVNNKIIYEKKTDSQGISEIKAYQETTITNNNNVEYVTLKDFNDFKNDIEKRLNGGNNE